MRVQIACTPREKKVSTTGPHIEKRRTNSYLIPLHFGYLINKEQKMVIKSCRVRDKSFIYMRSLKTRSFLFDVPVIE